MTQKEALDIMKLGHNVYLTGQAGSGKTHVLNSYIKYLKDHQVEVGITASTGIASTHLNGVTIHSWCGIGINDSLSQLEIDALEEKQYLWNRFKKAKVLIIDEVSMLHGDSLDLIDKVCKSFKRSKRPFGGLQVILCGDLFQLPPVVRGGNQSRYVFQSEAWKSMNIKICYLEEQFRQNDEAFVSVLNKIRSGEVDDLVYEILEGRIFNKIDDGDYPTKLYTHNIDVDKVNTDHLHLIDGAAKVYTMNSKGSPHLIGSLKKSCLAHEVLHLKQGAEVMFVKNNFERGYVNGTRGRVIGFSQTGNPLVRLLSEKLIEVMQEEWTIEEEGKVKAQISQIPLRLAWAITIHKSQGMSLDSAQIDLSKAFVAGQGYVALSRVRSLSGLFLNGFNPISLTVDPLIIDFDRELQKASRNTEIFLNNISASEIDSKCKEFILLCDGVIDVVNSKLRNVSVKTSNTYEETEKLVLSKKSIKEIAKIRGFTEGTILTHLEKLTEDEVLIPDDDLKYLITNKKSFEKISKVIKEVYKKTGEMRLQDIRGGLKNTFSFEDIRLVRLFFIKG